ncbi:MAG: hypothetical protein IJ038_02215 [Clostridia bacterium]|nr:hypothetical protein [Clostridia bacterium]
MYIVNENGVYRTSVSAEGAVVSFEPPIAVENGSEYTLEALWENENGAVYAGERDRVELSVCDKGDGLFYLKRKWSNLASESRRIQAVFRLKNCFEAEHFVIPCVSIDGNKFGAGLEPKGLERNGEKWIFGYDREPIPSCTLTENDSVAVSLFASAESGVSLVSSCSIFKDAQTGVFCQEIYHPKIEAPEVYCTRDAYCGPSEDFIELGAGDSFEVGMYVSVSAPRWKKYGICKTLDIALELFEDGAGAKVPDKKEIWDNSISFAKSLITDYKGKKAFIIGFLPNGEGGFSYRSDDNHFELAWCGQNVLLSRMLIENYIINGDREGLDTALEILDTRVKYCTSENGLLASQLRFCDDLESSASDTCNMGYGAYEFMRTYTALRRINIDKPEYLRAGLGLCDFFVDNFSEEYGFGKSWRHDGVCVDKGGTIGGFVIPALAKAYEITGDGKYLGLAERAMSFYMERDLDNFCCTAGALDTCCVDKETSAPFIMSSVLLYELTKKKIYLEYGEKSAYYFSSWMFCYDPVYDQDSDINRYGVSIRGLTSVSAQHHHLDMYAAIVVPYMRRLAELTKNDIWRYRAELMWSAVLQCIGDGTLNIHGITRPEGSQNEAIFHCSWGFRQYKRGNLNDWLVAWPCAFRLSVLAGELDGESLDI